MLFRQDEPERRTSLPVLPLRDLVVFPKMVVPLIVGRPGSRAALEAAEAGDKRIFLSAQRSGRTAEPGPDDVHDIGTVATIIQMLRLPDDNLKVLVEGQHRGKATTWETGEGMLRAEVVPHVADAADPEVEVEALVRSVRAAFEQYAKLDKSIAPEMLVRLATMEDPALLSDTLVAQLGFKLEERQQLLEEADPLARLDRLLRHLSPRPRSCRSSARSRVASRSRWRRARRSTTSTSRCRRSRRSRRKGRVQVGDGRA